MVERAARKAGPGFEGPGLEARRNLCRGCQAPGWAISQPFMHTPLIVDGALNLREIQFAILG